MSSSKAMQVAVPVVVKFTFLDLPDEAASPVGRCLCRRAKTLPALREPVGPEEYLPGCFADSALTKPSVPEEADSSRSDAETTVRDGDSSTGLASSSASVASSRSSSPSPHEERAAAGVRSSDIRPQRPLPPGRVTRALEQCKLQTGKVDGRTTVMLRNMPNNYTRAMLLAMLDSEGFKGLFDFVYLPFDFARRAGLGYAFINFVDPAAAQRFWQIFNGYCRWVIPTSKVSSVSWSDPLQGLAANIERYRNSPVMHPQVPEEYRPVLFRNGVPVPFPKPTKPIRPPASRN